MIGFCWNVKEAAVITADPSFWLKIWNVFYLCILRIQNEVYDQGLMSKLSISTAS